MRNYTRFGLLLAAVLVLGLVASGGRSVYAWTAPKVLNVNPATDSGYDYYPQATTDGAGHWVAVWQSTENLGGTIGTDYDIFVARSVDNGATWTFPAVLNTNAASDSGDDLYPQVTTDGGGHWVAVWYSYDTLGGTVGSDVDILVARSTDSGATWTAPAALNTNAATDSGSDYGPQVTTDRIGHWVAVWYSYDTLGGTIGTDCDILVARSADNGATWTAPAALNTNAATDSGGDYHPRVTTDGSGPWVATWDSEENLGGTIGADRDILMARSTDSGATWTAPAVLNANAATDSGGDYGPQVTADGSGHWVTVWYSNENLGGTIGTDNDVLVARSTDSGATWTAPAALNTNAASDSGWDGNPQLTTDGDGHWVAVWESNDSLGGTIGTEPDILVARSVDDGATWTAPAALNSNAASDSSYADDQYPQVTTDGAGHWVAVWSFFERLSSDDPDISVARSSDNGAVWTASAPLNANAATELGDDEYPQMTTDGDGHWVAVWQSDENYGGTIGTDLDILMARSSDNGATWTIPSALNTNAATDSGRDGRPQVTTDRAGHWVAVWHSSDSLGGTIGTDDDILIARSTDNGVTWTPPVPLNTNAASDHSSCDYDWYPQVTTDATGHWVAVWESGAGCLPGPSRDADIMVARSTDNGATWTAPAALNTNAASDSEDDEFPQVATDGAGNWVALWSSYDSLGGTIGTDADILVARSSNNGASWTAPVALNTNAASDSGHDYDPQVTTDRTGHWVSVWHSNDALGGTIGTDYDILMARSTDNGATWTVPAALNTNAAFDSGWDAYPQTTIEGGYWVAVWESSDTLGGTIGTDRDILTARSTDAGVTWAAPVALNTNARTDSDSDYHPQLAADDAGNWLAIWQIFDGDDGDYDILFSKCSRLQPGCPGAIVDWPNWTAPAALNTNAASDSGDDEWPKVTTDGVGRWVAVWESPDTLGGTIGTDQDILTARSADSGATWTAPAALNTNAASDSGADERPHMTTDGQGHWVAVWSSNDSLSGTIGTDYDILIARSTDNGATWTAPAALNTNAASDSGGDYNPRVATDGAGHWVVAWYSNDTLGGTVGTDYDIFVVRSSDNGTTWTPPAALNTNATSDSGYDGVPHVTTDATGHWVAVWNSEDTLGGTIGTDSDILVARSADNGATWTAPAALNTTAATDSGSDGSPDVAADGAGHWVAVWSSNDDLDGTIDPDYDIFTARSTDNGATWTATELLIRPDTFWDIESIPQITTDRAGNWVAVWHTYMTYPFPPYVSSTIAMSRSTDNGANWTAREGKGASGSGIDECAQVATDSMGNWLLVWQSSVNLGGTIGTDYDILFSRCSPTNAECPGADDDSDGVVDLVDNCPLVPNPDQENSVHPGTAAGDQCEDPDADLVFDVDDNCPDNSNHDQADTDGDAVGDACDNCPALSNAAQTNTDGDEWGDACDYCPTTSTPWYVPAGDQDCDGFTTTVESHAGTDPLDACPDGLSDDAWPPDVQAAQGCGFHDRDVDILDVLCYKPKVSGAYDSRYDLDANGAVNILDVLLYKPVFGAQCTNP